MKKLKAFKVPKKAIKIGQYLFDQKIICIDECFILLERNDKNFADFYEILRENRNYIIIKKMHHNDSKRFAGAILRNNKFVQHEMPSSLITNEQIVTRDYDKITDDKPNSRRIYNKDVKNYVKKSNIK